jgi:hypothetical protein
MGLSAHRGIRNPLGFVISFIGCILGTVVTLFMFVRSYSLLISTEITRGAPSEALLVTYILPALANLGFAGGILWGVSAYGFASEKTWSYPIALISSVLSILAGFFPILPYVSSGLGFPPTSIIFVINVLFFIILQRYPQLTGGRVLGLSLLMGIAYILAFINGVASTHYIMTGGGAYYSALEPLNFGASIAWGTCTVTYVLRKTWTSPLVVAAALASMLGSIPISLVSQAELARPSLFWPSPIVAIVVLALYYRLEIRR